MLILRNLLMRFSVVGCVLLLVACAVAPTQEMSDARQAIQAARMVGASSHTPDRLEQAESLLAGARSDLGKQAYGDARAKALAARETALVARAISEVLVTATQVVAKGQQQGLDVHAAEERLSKARQAARAGELKKLRRIAAEVQALMGRVSRGIRKTP